SGPRNDPPGPAEGEFRVQRGGSWLSPENYTCGHHVSARGKRRPEETYGHVGFRCVRGPSLRPVP
ncbi:MAG: SUMF1/EgtB/PvdO family nonheme iron enzyme, partial [Planctomycetales bacterium]|nr:SUMF1/EgtB/PvdO family nonheme iron enzyme [Planctomycetales bacterium]